MSASFALRNALVAATLFAGLAGCMTATPYQPDIAGQRISGGFSEQRLTEGRYRVNFAGNTLTSRDRVEGYLLYRAAELTVQNGYDWFLIIERLTERDVQTYVRPDPSYRPWYGTHYSFWRPHWRYRRGGAWLDWHPEWGDPFWAVGPDIVTNEAFEAHAEIVMRRGAVPEGEERAFDARRVMTDLGPMIVRPEPSH
jgi:hypothetical protein